MKNYSKPQKKRFAGGGSVEEEATAKEAGLKASQGEDVGFFKRLAMGNIDDPSSEAYKQFGAGRGRTRAPVSDAVPVPVSRKPVVEEDVVMPEKTREYRNTDYPTPAAPARVSAPSRPAAVAAPAVKPSRMQTGSGGRGGPTADELEAYAKSKQTGSAGGRGPSAEESTANERSKLTKFTPEDIEEGISKFMPVPGSDKVLTAVNKLLLAGKRAEAQALLANSGNMFSRAGSKANEYIQKLLEQAPSKIKGSSEEAQRRLTGPSRQLTGPERQKQIEFDRASEATGRSRRAAEGMSDAEAKAFRNQQNPRLSERDTTGGAIGYRKGGAVSASRRGDGIAQKGKTRGKMC
jgi:hypothetical protein